MPPLIKQIHQIAPSDTSIQSVTGAIDATPSSLYDDLQNIRKIVGLVSGSDNWYTAPATTLTSHLALVNAHIDWTNASSNLLTTGSGTFGSLVTGGSVTSVTSICSGSGSYNAISVTTNGVFGGYITVAEDSTFSKRITAADLTVTGTITVNNVSCSGSATFDSTTTIEASGSLVCSGTATFSSTVNVPTPSTDNNAANKSYVDSKTSALKSGSLSLSQGVTTASVTFSTVMSNSNYSISTALYNSAGSGNSIIPVGVTSKGIGGFNVEFASSIPESTYSLEWIVYNHYNP